MSGTSSSGVVERSTFTTADADETRDHLDTVYGWRLTDQRPAADDDPVVLEIATGPVLSSGVTVAPCPMSYDVLGQDYVVIDSLLAGTFELQHPSGTDRLGAGDLFVANHPDAEFTATTRDIRVLTTILPSPLLDTVARPTLIPTAPGRRCASPRCGRTTGSVAGGARPAATCKHCSPTSPCRPHRCW